MCASSAVSDYYLDKTRWPVNPFVPAAPIMPSAPQSPLFIKQADDETKEMMRQVLKLLDKIDKKLGDVECMDEQKAAFLKSLDLDPASLGG